MSPSSVVRFAKSSGTDSSTNFLPSSARSSNSSPIVTLRLPSALYSKLEDLPVPYGRLTSRFSSTADALLVSRKSNTNLFPFSEIYTDSKNLIDLEKNKKIDQQVNTVSLFWETIGENMDQWRGVRVGNLSAAEVRRDFIHTHVIILQALGHMGKDLLKQFPTNWKSKLKNLNKINWLKNNSVWQQRVIINGRVVKNNNSIILASNVIKKALGIKLDTKEKALESQVKKNGK